MNPRNDVNVNVNAAANAAVPDNIRNMILNRNSPIQSPLLSPLLSPINSPSQGPPGGKHGSLFVHKLHNMVFDQNYQHLISWNFQGNAFIVCNVLEFSRDVLPKHFKHNNFSSFVRQLNMYAFQKTNKSPRGSRTVSENQVWEFSHPKFLRDHPELLDEIKRKVTEQDNSSKNNSQVVSQLQTQLATVLSSVQSMQEQFTEVIRELNDVKRKSAIHQLMMKNVLMFIKSNMNLQPQQFPELAAAMQDPSNFDQQQQQSVEPQTPQQGALPNNNNNNNGGAHIQQQKNGGQENPLNIDNIDFSDGFDSLLPMDTRGDTMNQPFAQPQPHLLSTFTPPQQPQPTVPASASAYQTPQNTPTRSPYQQAMDKPPTSSPYQAPQQSPYHAPLQSPYQGINPLQMQEQQHFGAPQSPMTAMADRAGGLSIHNAPPTAN